MRDIEVTLKKIAQNLWCEWNANVHLLFRQLSPYSWSLFRRNLYRFIRIQTENPLLYQHRLIQLLSDTDFFDRYKKLEAEFIDYINPKKTHVSEHYPQLSQKTVAYFSMEYGFDILRTYSGGLGILSGDHLRGASDLGIKMVAVGLFYLHGYYEQQVGLDGTMKVIYEAVVPPKDSVRDFLPLEAMKSPGTTRDYIVTIPMEGRSVKARVWRARVGRTDLLLLDTNMHENGVHDRHITHRLYSSQKHFDQERRRRLEQEMLLGIGGVQALHDLGYTPSVYHLNEGHVAFTALEVLKRAMQQHSLSLEEARQQYAGTIGFTTHTPVAEGNERFNEGLVRSYLMPYLESFLSEPEREVVFNCARNTQNEFDMTKLSLLLAGGFKNGVSSLHGQVCRKMWGYAWGYDHEDQTPIGSITNSVHVPYWQKPLLRNLITESGGIEKVNQIDDEKIWSLHVQFKMKLIEKVRERYAFQMLREKADSQTIHDKTRSILDVDSFVIGFARRFAEYKRVTLLLDDEERLYTFLEKSYKKYGKPVHILYAGKPHPNNYAGRDKIKHIVQISERLAQRCRERNFRSQLIFVQGYDIDLARYLVAGVDVWLNNPIRPLEASGTSGMKAGMNGVLNVSIPDGWVPEGIVSGENGWLFGKGDSASEVQDREELFGLLENTILPSYFDRKASEEKYNGENNSTCPVVPYSKRWVELMKKSIQTITQQFNTDRMLIEYVEKMYLPALKSSSMQKMQAGTK
jgi:starch phosphorylase